MRGREVLLESFMLHGARHIFGNPGTTENPLLDGLVEYPDIRYVMALHEGVAVAAASAYAQASGDTPVVNLHAAPGLGNGLGMLFCAYKSRSPMIVTAGQQDVRLRVREPILQHDLVAMAAPVTKWSVQLERPDEVGPVLARAFKVANEEPRGPVFVALPVDVMEGETNVGATTAGRVFTATGTDPAGVAVVAELLLASRRPAIVVGDDAAIGTAGPAVVALAERLGAAVWAEPLRNQASFPTMHPQACGSLPLNTGAIRRTLGDADLVLLVGGRFFEELWFEEGSPFPDGARVVQVEAAPSRIAFNFAVDAGLAGDIGRTLADLDGLVATAADDAWRAAAKARAAALAAASAARRAKLEDEIRAMPANGAPMSSLAALAAIREAVPPGVIVVEESSTTRPLVARTLPFAPGTYFSGRGGGIGQGLPGGIGVKLAHPERPVMVLSGDGSGMFGIQALWTAAHHDLAVVFLIFANREYRVLKQNVDEYRARFRAPTDRPYPHMDLSQPDLDFVHLARGMGVPACRIDRVADLGDAVRQAFAAKSPYLIEMIVA